MAKKRAPHVRIDTRVFDLLPDIGSNGFCVYATLMKFRNNSSGRCYPSYKTIAKTTGLDRKTVIKYVDLLVEFDLIDKRSQFRDGHQTSNQYDFRPVPSVRVPPTVKLSQPLPHPGGAVPPHLVGSESDITKRQSQCGHKEIATPSEGVAYCRACFLDLETIECISINPSTPDNSNTSNNEEDPVITEKSLEALGENADSQPHRE